MAENALVAAAVRAAYGPADILVNNAGIALVKPLAEVDFAHWRRVLSTHLDSQFLMSTAFAADPQLLTLPIPPEQEP